VLGRCILTYEIMLHCSSLQVISLELVRLSVKVRTKVTVRITVRISTRAYRVRLALRTS